MYMYYDIQGSWKDWARGYTLGMKHVDEATPSSDYIVHVHVHVCTTYCSGCHSSRLSDPDREPISGPSSLVEVLGNLKYMNIHVYADYNIID